MKFLFGKIHQSDLFISFVMGIIFGTLLSLILKLDFFDSAIWVILVLILLFYTIIKPIRIFLLVTFLAGGILANFRVSFELRNQANIKDLVGETVEISGKISGDPTISEENTNLKIIHNGVSIFVQMYIPKNIEIKRGDILTLKGKVSEGFGVYSASVFKPELIKLSRSDGNFLIESRDSFAKSIKRSLGSDESSLGLAYLLGLRNGLSNEIVEILALVGLTHIVVASGTHLSILVGFTRKVFGKISRFAGLFFAILLVLGFAEIVGWTASITRAAIVSILSLLVWYVGRRIEPIRLILISMSITLLIDPMNLIDLGWLLSFASFSGILVLAPLLIKFFYGKKKPTTIVNLLIVTLSATIMTTPILLYYFGSLSLISLLANLLILPTIPLSMGLTFLTGLTGFFPIAKLTNLILEYHLLIMKFFSSQTMFLIQIPKGNSLVFMIYLPVVLFLITIEIRANSNRKKTQQRLPCYFSDSLKNS